MFHYQNKKREKRRKTLPRAAGVPVCGRQVWRLRGAVGQGLPAGGCAQHRLHRLQLPCHGACCVLSWAALLCVHNVAHFIVTQPCRTFKIKGVGCCCLSSLLPIKCSARDLLLPRYKKSARHCCTSIRERSDPAGVEVHRQRGTHPRAVGQHGQPGDGEPRVRRLCDKRRRDRQQHLHRHPLRLPGASQKLFGGQSRFVSRLSISFRC